MSNPWGIGVRPPAFINLDTYQGQIEWSPRNAAQAESQQMVAATAASPHKRYSSAIEPAGTAL